MGSWVSERCLRMSRKSFSQVDDYFCHMLTELYQNGPAFWACINCSFNLDWGFPLRKPFPGLNDSIYWFFFFLYFPLKNEALEKKSLYYSTCRLIVLFLWIETGTHKWSTQSNSPFFFPQVLNNSHLLYTIMFFKYSLVMIFPCKVNHELSQHGFYANKLSYSLFY